jgi:hypothetical protein
MLNPTYEKAVADVRTKPIKSMKTESFGWSWLGIFQPETLNPERLNLDYLKGEI